MASDGHSRRDHGVSGYDASPRYLEYLAQMGPERIPSDWPQNSRKITLTNQSSFLPKEMK